VIGNIKFGMKLSDLTDEILSELIILYDETVGGNGRYYPQTAEYVQRTLEGGHSVEKRCGSRLTGHSKLWIRWSDTVEEVICFSFGANTVPGEASKREIRKLEQSFENAVDNFLTERGLAIELPKR